MKVSKIIDVRSTLAYIARPYALVEVSEKDTRIIDGLEDAGKDFLQAVVPILIERLEITSPVSSEKLAPFMAVEIPGVEEHFHALIKRVKALGLDAKELHL